MNVLYNKIEFDGMEYPYVEQKYVADSLSYRRYFPVDFVSKMIAEENTRNAAYTALLNAYNTKVAAYNV